MTTPNTAVILTPLDKIEKHLFSPQVMAKFAGVLDKSAAPFIRSVMIAVEADLQLQKCTPESIGVSALRAASLQLSCDPATKQAYLIAYFNKKKNCFEAQFQPHYLGLYALAVRTNKYSVINVTPFPADYRMELDLNSGDYVILNGEGKVAAFAPKVKPEEAGAWYGYLRTTRGFVKKVWMTKQEIHEHARKFSRNYNSDNSMWKNKDQVATMEMKTVLRELLNWADKSGYGDNTLREALASTEEVIEAETTEAPSEPVTEGKVKEEAQSGNGNPDPIDDKAWELWEQLCKRAEAVQVPHANINRETTTKGDLRSGYKELLAFVQDAEEQAQAA